jgi:uncharacterized protein
MQTQQVSLGVFLAAVWAAGQGVAADKPDIRASVLVPERAAPGSKVPVVVEMTIPPGWHVNSHTPSDKFLIPTSVMLASTARALSPFRYPPDVEKRLSFSDKPLKVYEGTVRFEADLELPAEKRGDVNLSGALTYQACNDAQCLAPAKIPLQTRFVIAAEGR